MTTERTATKKPRHHLWQSFAFQVLVLTLLWLLLSGHYDLLHLGYGAASIFLVLWMNRRIMTLTPGEEGQRHARPLRVLLYLPWIFWQMILSAIHVARAIVSPAKFLRPSLVRFTSLQPNVVADVILANSITLTPGTLTVDLEGKEFLVHALTETTAEGVLDGSMQRKVAELFGEPPAELMRNIRRNVEG